MQMIVGQEDPEQDIRDLIDQMHEEMENYINPSIDRLQAYANGYSEEYSRLQQEYNDLREELDNLALELSEGKPDVSTCLDKALEDAYGIYQDRANELQALYRIEFVVLNQIFSDLSAVNSEKQNAVSNAENSIEYYCKRLATTEEVNDCYGLVLSIFDETKNDILNRLMEIYELIQNALETAEETQQTFNESNRQFVIIGQEDPEQDLRDLIDKANQEFEEYINPLQERVNSFGTSFVTELEQLQKEYAELRDNLTSIAEQLSTEVLNTSACWSDAVQTAYFTYLDRDNEVAVIQKVTYQGLAQVFIDISLAREAIFSLILRSEDSIETCKSLSSEEEINACYDVFLPVFDEMKADVLNRVMKLYDLGQTLLEAAEKEKENLSENNRQLAIENAELITDQLIECIGNLTVTETINN
ncbi:hypothetical protein L9F63_009113 [Diploptera punctata]|uniref:Uncharacterized protein n=1 Tax=Diploptera punctata TaxID=6984 RepID=A0AAD7Z3Z2_DIPPU|nr:hypothetical protein L9F63_009113 [Diploptera punctata]